MARTALAVQDVTRDGLNATMSAANADGHSVQNTSREILKVTNGSGSSINVTIPTPQTVDGLAVTDRVVAVPAGETRYIGAFPSSYNQSDGKLHVDFSSVTSITCAALRIA